MSLSEKFKNRFQELISEGDKLQGNNDIRPFQKWVTQSVNLVSQVSGGETSHHSYKMRTLSEVPHGSRKVGEYVAPCLGVLEAAYEDFKRGSFVKYKDLVTAEVFDDYLGQAEELYSKEYFRAAAAIAGATLEDTLRKLCDKQSPALAYAPGRTKIGELSAVLYGAGVYDRIIHGRVVNLGQLRNDADHGNDLTGKEADIKDMIEWVRRFIADYLSR